MARRYDKISLRIGNEVWRQVEALLRQEWRPEQIAGRNEREQGVCISHEWVYQYICADKRSGGDLYRYLRCQNVRRKRYRTYNRPGVIPDQVSIDKPPPIIHTQRRFGDWEGDTVIGKGHRGALVTLFKRKPLVQLFIRLSAAKRFTLRKEQVHSITYKQRSRILGP